MSSGIPLSQLVVGRLYRVEMDDCCVQGWFTSRLTEVVRDEEGDPWELRFEHGGIGPAWGSWTISEEQEPAADCEDRTLPTGAPAGEEAGEEADRPPDHR